MKKTLTVFLFFTAVNLTAQIIDTIAVGLQTADLALDHSGAVIALSQGRDLNFDWLTDSTAGETAGTLFRIDPQTHEILAKRSFSTAIGKLAVSGETGYFVQAKPMRISTFDTQTLTTKIDTFILENTASGENFKQIELSIDRLRGRLIIGTGGYSGTGEARIMTENGKLQHAMRTGPGASDAVAFFNDRTRSTGILMINEGIFNANNATLSYLNVQENFSQNIAGVELGDTGNDLLCHGDRLFVVLNGSHSVQIFDLQKEMRTGMVDMRTLKDQGPRRILMLPGDSSAAVTTYKNDVRIFDIRTLQITDSLAVGQKPERMAVFGNMLFVANGGFTGFAADSTIFVIDLTSKTVVDTIVTGLRTLDIFLAEDNRLYALSEGRDMNFDGRLQAGETPAALFKIDPARREIIAKITFSDFAGNLALMPKNNSPQLLLRQSNPDRISQIDGKSFHLTQDSLLLAEPALGNKIYALGYDAAADQIWATTAVFDGNRGKFFLIDPVTQEIMAQISCGILPRQAIAMPSPVVPGAIRWYVLNEGFYNANQASLTTFEAATDIFAPIAGKPLGDTANGLTQADGKIYIAVNGSHTVQVLDIESWTYAGQLVVGTTGWDGPRQVAIQNHMGFVSTFNNDVRTFDLTALKLEEIIPVGQKPEDLLLVADKLFIANAGFSGFAEDSTIFVMQTTITDVKTSSETRMPATLALAQNYPNPFELTQSGRRTTQIEFHLAESGHITLKIYNIRGQLVAKLFDGVLATGMHSRKWGGRDRFGRTVSSGLYFYRLKSEKQIEFKTMLVRTR